MKKRILSILLLCCMVLTLLPTTVLAADGPMDTIPKYDVSIDVYNRTSDISIKDSRSYYIYSSVPDKLRDTWAWDKKIFIKGDKTAPHIFIDGVNIEMSPSSKGPAIELNKKASAYIYFIGKNSSLQGADGRAAIQKNRSEGQLYVLARTGTTVTCKGGDKAAGIGGSYATRNISNGYYNGDMYGHGVNMHFGSRSNPDYWGGTIAAIGGEGGAGIGGGHDEREQTLNQLLVEMDGFAINEGVIVMAATNRADILDPALLRPGRFDRQVYVGAPDVKGREEILKVHAKKVKVAPGVDFNTVARMASGASGAELANIVNEAALRAVRAGRKSVTQADLEESIEVVIAGYQKKNSILTDKEKCIVAYHEIGHALVAAKQTHSAPVQKITIIPRTSGALGFTMQVEEGNHYLMDKTELENKIATLTGGRAAEEVAFGSITTGASNDIEQATKLARAMLTRYGMSDEFDMVALETVNNQYLGGDTSLACSAQTQREIDQKVVELVKAQHAKALQILTENRDKLDQLAKFLYEKETITGEEFMAILNGEEKTE